MAIIDAANDRYNPPSNRGEDFEETFFVDIEPNDLFWLKAGGMNNSPFRKVNETTASNLKGRITQTFGKQQKVYVRT